MMTVDDLLLALGNAQTDVQRLAALQVAPARVRAEFAALMGARGYLEMMTEPTDPLLARLDAAVDDTERATLLRTATPKDRVALATDIWWRNASDAEAAQAYLEMIDPSLVVRN
jgi:hypothetical protein